MHCPECWLNCSCVVWARLAVSKASLSRASWTLVNVLVWWVLFCLQELILSWMGVESWELNLRAYVSWVDASNQWNTHSNKMNRVYLILLPLIWVFHRWNGRVCPIQNSQMKLATSNLFNCNQNVFDKAISPQTFHLWRQLRPSERTKQLLLNTLKGSACFIWDSWAMLEIDSHQLILCLNLQIGDFH